MLGRVVRWDDRREEAMKGDCRVMVLLTIRKTGPGHSVQERY